MEVITDIGGFTDSMYLAQGCCNGSMKLAKCFCIGSMKLAQPFCTGRMKLAQEFCTDMKLARVVLLIVSVTC
jgi:hypothetical protein